MATISIHCESLVQSFAPQDDILRIPTLDVLQGSFTVLLGSSGCGKTSFLRLVAGLDKPTQGKIELRDSAPILSYVFQEAHLLPWRTALENVLLPLEFKGSGPRQSKEKGEQALERVGLGNHLGHYPSELSLGMRMRVSLARALVVNPTLLLLDEPFAALDEITRFRLDEQLLTLWSASKPTILFVTHSMTEAAFLAERILLFSRRRRGIADDVSVPFPFPRTSSLRGESEFARFVQDLRRKFESLEGER